MHDDHEEKTECFFFVFLYFTHYFSSKTVAHPSLDDDTTPTTRTAARRVTRFLTHGVSSRCFWRVHVMTLVIITMPYASVKRVFEIKKILKTHFYGAYNRDSVEKRV